MRAADPTNSDWSEIAWGCGLHFRFLALARYTTLSLVLAFSWSRSEVIAGDVLLIGQCILLG